MRVTAEESKAKDEYGLIEKEQKVRSWAHSRSWIIRVLKTLEEYEHYKKVNDDKGDADYDRDSRVEDVHILPAYNLREHSIDG